jgi:hypothetical protein
VILPNPPVATPAVFFRLHGVCEHVALDGYAWQRLSIESQMGE